MKLEDLRPWVKGIRIHEVEALPGAETWRIGSFERNRMRIPEEAKPLCWPFVDGRVAVCRLKIAQYLAGGRVEYLREACEAARMAWGLALDLTGEREEP
jgi:hypothetical protein